MKTKDRPLSEQFLLEFAYLAEQAPPKRKLEADRLYRLGERIYLALARGEVGLDALYQHNLLMEKVLGPSPTQKPLNLTTSATKVTTKKKKWRRSKSAIFQP